MGTKHVYAPHLGRTVRLGGRIIPRTPHNVLRFSHLLHANLPTPPSSTNFHTSADAGLRPIDLNDQLGDCVCAGIAHRLALLTGAANPGSPYICTPDQVLELYKKIGGYVPGDPGTDQGCDMTVAANYCLNVGYPDGSKDVGFIAVDASSKAQVMLAFWTAENGDLGLALPDAWLSSFPEADGFVWDVAGDPDPSNGHDVQIIDYDADKGVLIDTWGLYGWITWAALAKYGVASGSGELIVHLNQDQINKATQKAPNGIDWATIVQFYDLGLGGNVPVPVQPMPPGPVTLAHAQAMAVAGVSHGAVIQTRSGAARNAAAGLSDGWPKT